MVLNPPEWSDEMSVGNSILDADHQSFLVLTRLLFESQKHHNQLVILSAIHMLEEYVGGHFLREEKAMKAAKYPQLAAHTLKHGQFRARVKAIAEVYKSGTLSAADGLAEIVQDWLRQHVLDEDKLYVKWISDIHVDTRPLGILALEAQG
ncbi:MAG: hemerythrin family protein [Alphaproteobacteria bacterium]|nr:hemerythrin family protein [Alphaproteobacteria bacterium]